MYPIYPIYSISSYSYSYSCLVLGSSSGLRSTFVLVFIFVFVVLILVLVSVVVWLVLATRFELPVSTTHTAIGGILGMVMVAEGADAVEWEKVRLVITSWFVSPLMSGGIGFVIMFLLSVLFLRPYTYLKGWWREPFNRSLLFFPVFVFPRVAPARLTF